MSLLKLVTPEEAKRVWLSIPDPSARRVAKALTQSGRRVHAMERGAGRRQLRPVRHAGDVAVEGLHHSEDELPHAFTPPHRFPAG
jgi:hypothetical protein